MSFHLMWLYFCFIILIPTSVHSQCYSTSSQAWMCDNRFQRNNFTYETIFTNQLLTDITFTNYRLPIFKIDHYPSTLQVFNASHNQFQTIIITGKHRFTSNLKQLILQSNQLEQFSLETIVLPYSLEKISLADNRLRILDARIFSHLTHLTEIDLRNNLLKRILPQLLIGRTILLNSNPLECPCTSESYRIICEKATTIKRSQSEQNNCLAPYYNSRLHDFQPVSYLRFSTFTLVCPISGQPPPIIVWSTPFGNLTSINSSSIDLLTVDSPDEPIYITLTALAGPLTARTQHTLHAFGVNHLSVTRARAALQHRISCSGINMLGVYTYDFGFDIETFVLPQALWQIIYTMAFGFFLSLVGGALCVTLKRTYHNGDNLKTPPIYPTMAPNSAARTPPNFELNQWLSLAAANISGTLEQVRDKLRLGVQQVSDHMGQTMGRGTELFTHGVQHAGRTIRQAAETSAAYLHSFRETSQQRFNTMRVQTMSSLRNPGHLMRAGMNILTTQVNSLRDYCGVIAGHQFPPHYLYHQQQQQQQNQHEQFDDLRYSPAPLSHMRLHPISTITEEDENLAQSQSLLQSTPYAGHIVTVVHANTSGIGRLEVADNSALSALNNFNIPSNDRYNENSNTMAQGQMSGGIGIFQGHLQDYEDDLINEPERLIMYGEQRPAS